MHLSLFGALGIMVATALGGVLFDKWMNAGPFVFMGFVNFAVFLWALSIRRDELAIRKRELA